MKRPKPEKPNITNVIAYQRYQSLDRRLKSLEEHDEFLLCILDEMLNRDPNMLWDALAAAYDNVLEQRRKN